MTPEELVETTDVDKEHLDPAYTFCWRKLLADEEFVKRYPPTSLQKGVSLTPSIHSNYEDALVLILELNEKHRGCSVGAKKGKIELKVPDNIYTPRGWNSFLRPFKTIEDVRDFIDLSDA